MNRRLPPGLYERQYRTRGRYLRTLYYPRFVCWDGKRRTWRGIDDFEDAKAELARLKKLNRERFDFDAAPLPAAPRPSLYPWIHKLEEIAAGRPIAERHKYSIQHLKDFFGDCALTDITYSRMKLYRTQREKAGRAPSTINRELQCLRSILLLAHHDGQLPEMPKIPLEAEENERVRTATPSEYRRILKELSVDERDFTEMIREMGFRLKDIAAITPADVIFESRAIDMRRIRSKRGHKRPLPLSPRAWSILSRRARGKGKTARLFPFTRSHVRHAFQRACARLGIRDLWLYDLKSTFVTEKFREGWPEKIIQEFTGNKTPGTFRRYQRPTDDDLRRFIGAKRRRSGNKRRGRLQETPVTY